MNEPELNIIARERVSCNTLVNSIYQSGLWQTHMPMYLAMWPGNGSASYPWNSRLSIIEATNLLLVRHPEFRAIHRSTKWLLAQVTSLYTQHIGGSLGLGQTLTKRVPISISILAKRA
jgi:hypothetical protein